MYNAALYLGRLAAVGKEVGIFALTLNFLWENSG
jgi:hypothetical protein